MKMLTVFVLLLALMVLCVPVHAQPPATGGDCPTCVRVRVALALAKAQAVPVATTAKPTPKPTVVEQEPEAESTPAPAPVRIYRMGSLPQGFSQPAAPVYYSVPQGYCPTGVCTIPGR